MLALLAVTSMVTTGAFADEQALAAAFEGTYEYAGDEAEEQGRLDAIERAIAGVPKLFRGIGRKRLSAAADVTQTYVFEPDGEELTIRSDGLARTTRLDGTPVDIGGGVTLTRTLQDREIRSSASREDGGASYRFTLSPDGQTLVVETTLESPQLQEPCVYTSTYRRK